MYFQPGIYLLSVVAGVRNIRSCFHTFLCSFSRGIHLLFVKLNKRVFVIYGELFPYIFLWFQPGNYLLFVIAGVRNIGSFSIVIFLAFFCPRRKGTLRLSLCEAPIRKIRPDHKTGTTCPTLFDKCVDTLTTPSDYVTLKIVRKTGPYPRRLERLTICRYNFKDSPFSSVILDETLSVGPGLEPSTSRTADWRSTN